MSKNLAEAAAVMKAKAKARPITMDELVEAITNPDAMKKIWREKMANEIVEANGYPVMLSMSMTGGIYYQLAISLMPLSGAPNNDTCDIICRAFWEEPPTEVSSALGNTRQFIWKASIVEGKNDEP